MKLVNYIHSGCKGYGIYTDEGIIDLRKHIGDEFPTLKDFLSADFINIANKYIHCPANVNVKEITFLPVIDNPDKIICVGMNYAEKRKEFNENNPAPTLFVRFADSQTGHRQPVLKPHYSSEFDYEGELAVVIGQGGENIPADQALSHVAGYSCYMDGSARDWQHTWYTAGKNGRQTGAFGPWMTTSDVIPDPHQLAIRTWLNGKLMQDDNTGSMIHRVAELIAYISTFTALSAGDVIITGSPGGVGKKRNPPVFMQAGDRIEVEIEHIGRLSNVIADAPMNVANTEAVCHQVA